MRHMPHSTFSPAVPLPSAKGNAADRCAALFDAIMAVLSLPRRVIANRRDMALLGAMSANQLADIGLSRQDVVDAAALPLGTSPGALLTLRARERRRARPSR